MANMYRKTSELPVDVPLLILHPNEPTQHIMMASVLNQKDRQTIFVSLQTPLSDLNEVWRLLGQALSDQLNITLPRLEARATPEKAAQSLLNAVKSIGQFTLVIDAFDLANE